mmetsp:Transcript_30881/g.102172  ORF Transcript_30881/g.102172 Transcript_30881/m.102172 type:complete len:616 (-) Transcript_30881:1050-2897(-)
MELASAKRQREAADNRDAAFRIVLGAAGSDFLGLRDRLTQEPTCKEFALVDDQRRSLRTDSFRTETKGWRASPATAALLVKSLDAPANVTAGANASLSAIRAARAWRRACVAIAALADNVGLLFAAGVADALMLSLSQAMADGDSARAILCFDTVTALLEHDETNFAKQSEWGESYEENTAKMRDAAKALISTNLEVSDAFMDAGLIDAIGAVAATREPGDGELREAGFLVLSRIVWLSEHALPRVTAPLVTNLLELIATIDAGGECEHLDALTHIIEMHFKKFTMGWPEDAPQLSCAAGALDPLVSPHGLELLTVVIRKGYVLELGTMFGYLAQERDFEQLSGYPYARSIATSETLLEALYEIVALDDKGAQDYLDLTHGEVTVYNSDGSFKSKHTHSMIRSHSGYAGTTWTKWEDPRVAALEAISRLVRYGGFPDGSRLRPLVPLLTRSLARTVGPDAEFGPDIFDCREAALLLIERLSGSKYGLSREIADAGGPAAILDVIERNRLPGSTAVPELVMKVQGSAWYALLAIAAAGQLGPVRLAVAASGIVQPGAPDLSEAQGLIDGASSQNVATSGTNLQKCLRWLADVTPESWADRWLPLEVVQEVIDNGRI